MSKTKILFLSVLSTLSLTSCVLVKTNTNKNETDYVEILNPSTLAEQDIEKEYFKYQDRQYTLSEWYDANTTFSIIFKQINNFESVSKKEELESDYADVYLNRKPVFLFGCTYHLKIYSDGYIISYNPSYKEDDARFGEKEYYYQMDQSNTDKLFEKLHYVYNEDLRIEKDRNDTEVEFNKKRENFTFEKVLNEFYDTEYVTFCSSDISNKNPGSPNLFKVTNNENIKNLVKNAKYTETTFRAINDVTAHYTNYFRFEHVYEPGNYYTFEMREGENIVRIQYRLVDSFRRNYDKDFAYSIDRTSAQNIFNYFVKYSEEHSNEAVWYVS